MQNNYLSSVKKQFLYYKSIGEKAIEQVPDEKIDWHPSTSAQDYFNEESNSIATIVKHLSGNMLSRWTDFLTTDGEKEWRNRDSEFENDIKTKQAVLEVWNKGWACFFHALDELRPGDIERIVYIRSESHTVLEAINRQLAHYPYHVGQIVFLSKMLSTQWKSLSIPKNQSKAFNDSKSGEGDAKGKA